MTFARALVVALLAALPAQEPSSVSLENGMRIVAIERPALPLVSFALYLRGGQMLDGPATFRHTTVAATCAWTGHDDLDEEGVRAAAADLGAHFGGDVDLQDTRIWLTCLAQHAERGLALLAGTVLRPSFDEQVVARERDRELRRLTQRRRRAEDLAQQTLMAALADEHPLARAFALEDRDGALAAADRAAIVAAWRRQAQPQLATLFVVGRGAGALRDAACAAFAGWPRPESATDVPVPELPAMPAGKVVKVPLPEATQVWIQAGMAGPRLDDPLAPAVQVLFFALAGGFTSLLEDELRVERGLVYDVGFRIPPTTFAPPCVLGTATHPDNVAEVLDATCRALRTAAAGGLRDSQIEAARNMWLVQRAAERETHLGAADAAYRSLRLSGDFAAEQRTADAVAATTPAQVAEAAERFDPRRLVVVLVGAPDALAKIEWRPQ